jgi:hypothetical protein
MSAELQPENFSITGILLINRQTFVLEGNQFEKTGEEVEVRREIANESSQRRNFQQEVEDNEVKKRGLFASRTQWPKIPPIARFRRE